MDSRNDATRRHLLTGGAALAGAALAKLTGPDSASAGHAADETVFHVDVTNTTAGSTRVSSNVAGTAAFVALNNHPSGISRPDAILGRTGYTTSNCAGVAGTCEADSGGIGVQGATDADNGTGVYGYAGSVVPSESSGGGVGVFGRGPSIGVLGRGATAVGVQGEGTSGTGVRGTSSAGGTGVRGDASGGPNAVGVNGQGVAFGVVGGAQGGGSGVFGASSAGVGTQGNTDTGVGVLGAASGAGLAARFVGRTVVEGALEVAGGMTASVVTTRDGFSSQLYSPVSPDPWLEDFGEAKIVKGRAVVRLKKDFDALVNGRDYQVFLTEYGNLGGLYVAKRREHSFEIRARRGRRARGRVGYRIVARRADVKAARMPRAARLPHVKHQP